ncbi:MAG TPA: TauD/TfdA family dioxygenase [Caulobacteraceae bacterium]|jgi:alpha-ketoglutarate-dependent taurine dioxygenase|nr:TauD/TfdA family dioxygenase [Caulobacteraceae bacterium]
MPGAPFQLEPLAGVTFGAVVTGVRVADLDETGFAALYEAWLQHALLIFPDQHLSREQQVSFARRFGPMEFDLAPISNVRSDGSVRDPDDDDVVRILKGNMGWHCDSTYMAVQAKGAVFSAEVVPAEGGETGWSDMRAAWDALPADRQARLEGLSASHSLAYSQSKLGHVHKPGSAYSGYGLKEAAARRRPLVKTHPETGRKALMIGRHAFAVTGLDEAASEALLTELEAFACRPPRVHHHRWTPGDVVVWDNRCLMHRARPWDLTAPRVMHHSRIAGDPVAEFAPEAG